MTTKKIKIVIFERGPKHYLLFREEFLKRLPDIEIVGIAEERGFDTTNCSASKFNTLRNLLRKQDDELTILLSSTAELFPEEADIIITFSAYKSWFDASRFKIAPYVWEQAQYLDSLRSSVEWQQKPKLSVGFLGNSYEYRRCVTLATQLPQWVKQNFVEGKHLKYIYRGTTRLAQTLGLVPCFMRLESLNQLTASNLDTDIIKYNKAASVTKQEITSYQDHMLRNTYILCPRAIENYSFRFYETLAHGRVPILIDTDTVLPSGVNWNELCVRVPYHKLHELEQIITEDYESKSKQDFIERQQKALNTMKQLNQFNWLKNMVDEIVQAAY